MRERALRVQEDGLCQRHYSDPDGLEYVLVESSVPLSLECQSTPDFDHARIARERPGSYRWFVAPFFEVLYVAPFNHLGALSRFECA